MMIEKLSARWARHGYPQFVWWIPLVMYSSTAIALVIGVAQRAGSGHVGIAALLAALSAVPWVFDAFAIRLRWWVTGPVAAAPALALMVLHPVDYDFVVFSIVMLVGHLGALEKFWQSLVATALICTAVAVAGLAGPLDAWAFWLAGIVVGWDIGFIMQYQQRQLDDQQRLAAGQQAAAVLEERQRIAREVHDVIAHSLSVTLLHLTAARRSLEDEDVDVAEASEALLDAERLGRQAMAEIRHTVGLLGTTGGTAPRPAPDLRDLPALVSEFRGAGLDVVVEVSGSPEEVPAQNALGLYRIAQESLANIAKHQPTSRAVVVLEADASRQALQIWNTLPAAVAEGAHDGAGLLGMEQRARLLDGHFAAGPRDGVWVVEVAVPARAAETCRLGLPKLLRGVAGRAGGPSPSPSLGQG